MAELTFLGTGNYLAPDGRYWNSFLLDGRVLVEPSPTALPHLRRCGISPGDIEAVVVSHFHPDHTFGWPFLLLAFLRAPRTTPLHVVGPPGVREFLGDMMRLGGVADVDTFTHSSIDIRYVEVDGQWQAAGSLKLRAIEVVHVPHLRCFGYLLRSGEQTIGYSGDSELCAGLEELARESDALVLECNSAHAWPGHMNTRSVAELRAKVPDVPFILTHVDESVTASDIEDCRVAADFDEIVI